MNSSLAPVTARRGESGRAAGVRINAMTNDGVPYIDADGTTKTADGVQALQSMTEPSAWGGEENGQYWYVAGDGTSTEVQFTERVTVRGDVRLILADNATLTASKDIIVTGDGNSLTIYAQSTGEGMGQLVADATSNGGSNHDAGIGGLYADSSARNGGKVTVNGGAVTATGNSNAAGIGGSAQGDGGTVEIGRGLSVEAGASAQALDTSVTVASYCASEGKNHNVYAYARICPATYTVTVADGIQNGTVSVDKSEAAEGDTVKVTATPAGDVTVSEKFVNKAAPQPEPTPGPQPADIPPVSVTAHVQRKGTLPAASGGAIADTTGKRLRMESVRLTVPGASEAGGIEYRGHVQRSGWMAWAKNGASAGTQGVSRRTETIQVVLVAKDGPAPATTYKGVTQQYAKTFVKK